MTRKKKKWLLAIGGAAGIAAIVLFFIGRSMATRFEPYIREQAVSYLEKRFNSEAEIGALRISLPRLSPYKILFERGKGTMAHVEGDNILLRHKGRRDIAPMFVMKHFTFDVDLGTLFESPKRIQMVTIDGMEINIPPKGQRPDMTPDDNEIEDDKAAKSASADVLFDEVLIHNSMLAILPRKEGKKPLQFDLHQIRLLSAGKNVAMKYEASLTNAKPPGEIDSKGVFGPWAATEPGDTPLDGGYVFDNADLGVFRGIAGILHSTGTFSGTLDTITAKGEATVPDFRLKKPGRPVPLKTKFEVLVDGTNGNTVLKPVVGTLGTTTFTTSGAVIKHEDDKHRTISLDVDMPKGNLRDILTLAMKGDPFMTGQIAIKTKVDIPPLSGKVKEKLLLDGHFDITNGHFLKSKIQDKIDELSRRAQGQPKNMEIDEVIMRMAGAFKMEDQVITFSNLSFAVPGSGVDLAGNYDIDQDVIDFHGTLKLDAKISETLTGWKRWLAKPIDPFFSKNGAGTFLKIQIVGSSKEPKFGRDKSKDEEKDEDDDKDKDKDKKDKDKDAGKAEENKKQKK
jgi:hypothetical protein